MAQLGQRCHSLLLLEWAPTHNVASKSVVLWSRTNNLSPFIVCVDATIGSRFQHFLKQIVEMNLDEITSFAHKILAN
ncbi:hypothetical protein BRADI_1g01958v3 [Brachypodium distachyon]|uniref:Uncharacterized protein n=1 Tax=Brachypodium distachyon TaxID=15368 RepID=A0A0Q3N636_BRADI|nr:hypothetical protein BRADI_1g01958v3 [Brachypodium distachyon]